MRGSLLWILACLSVWGAAAVTDGWSVPIAAFALWVGALLVLVAIGALAQRRSPLMSMPWRRAVTATQIVPASGGDAAVDTRAPLAPVALRMRLQQPSAVRDFALAPAWIENWYQRQVPVPNAVLAPAAGCADDAEPPA